MITIDGSQGEGGGQVLRSALALSLVTGRPFAIERIRAGRAKPGLLRQHLTAVEAAAGVGQATVGGAAMGSTSLTFTPGPVRAGDYHFAVGTAGSATLVLQTVLPALLCADGPSNLRLEGGTHNPFAPPFDFLARAFLPLVNRQGPTVTATLIRPGFYPAGGGEFHVSIAPAARLAPLALLDRGRTVRMVATARVAHLPLTIAERELGVIGRKLGLPAKALVAEEIETSRGPGNVVVIEVESEHVTEIFTGFGERGVPAETVAQRAAQQARKYLSDDIPVGEHLADQLLIPLALAGGGAFRTRELSRHAETNIEVIQRFLDVTFSVEAGGGAGRVVRIGGS